MTDQPFVLQPFPTDRSWPDLEITGSIARHANLLTLHYHLANPLETVKVPPWTDCPVRKHELWEDTCFEFFLGVKNAPRYWEFNLSPAGHWNIYCFDGYRQGMQEELAWQELPFGVQHASGSVSLDLTLDLGQIIPAGLPLEAAIATVLNLNPDGVTYWALTHCATEADFHQRDSFSVAL